MKKAESAKNRLQLLLEKESVDWDFEGCNAIGNYGEERVVI